ncbi:hypothetical protein DFQ01_105278 [Paenibacillus cellulosilyticus]|uniref:Sporulation lipoprotein YhcN/YlaJ n=1 Tax=Paenibacillus cellulosilyticus TaxID=375489 RepID=A0A2V2YVH7_9BACL|nr:hypothetical protein [Paenibacillus cellulosilyticus]PWW05293.1 hypothetical protein DFQ01_105278 [Paenibacillus cellulosilyticus]QKS43613.1 hypothetical protein HUB94_03515 [Paenibacillus cellulosilyticus]
MFLNRFAHSRIRNTANRKLLLGLLAVGLIVLEAGCGGGSGKYDNKMRVQHYGHDGYMGLTNTNPSLPNSPHSLTIKNDTDFVDQKLRELKGIAHSRTVIDGARLTVTIDAASGLSAAERAQLKKKAIAVVQQNMPRYEVDVHMTP